MSEYFIRPKAYDQAIEKLDQRIPLAARMKSAEWATVPVELRERAFFSAQVENARFLQEMRGSLDAFLRDELETLPSGDQALKTGGRAHFIKVMQEKAIAQGLGLIGEGGMGGIQDVAGESRLRLIFDTQVKAAEAFAYAKHGDDPNLLAAFPAQRFIRSEPVSDPRPLHVANTGVVKRKDDTAFWLSMNSPDIGGFGVPWGPWGFFSGMDVEDVDRAEAIRLGLIKPSEVPKPQITSFNKSLSASTDGIDQDILSELRSSLGDQVEEKDGRIYWKGLAGEIKKEKARERARANREKRKAAAANPYTADGWPKNLGDLEVVQKLGGSTGAQLVKHKATSEKFVLKKGATAAHVREEVTADNLYRKLGVDAPDPRLYEVETGPVKLTRYIENGESLDAYLRRSNKAQREEILARVKAGFLPDAILGNWDVIGLGRDNILVTPDGRPIRIDNGGSLRFRAQGGAKAFTADVEELSTMLDAQKNPSAAAVFAGLTRDDLQAQFKRYFPTAAARQAFLEAVPADLRDVMAARIADVERRLFRGAAFPKDPEGRVITNRPDEEFATAVRAARASGRALAWDGDQIEDFQVIFWEETARTGERVLKASMRLTEMGSRDVYASIADRLGPSPGVSEQEPVAFGKQAGAPYPQDDIWADLLAAAKTIGAHASDGAYNATKINALTAAEARLTKNAPKYPSEFVEHYKAAFAELKAAMTERRPPAALKQWASKPTEIRAPESLFTPSDSIEWKTWEFFRKERSRGALRETWEANGFRDGYAYSESVKMNLGPDSFAMFQPWKVKQGTTWRDSAGMTALRGNLEFTLKGGATPENVAKVAEHLKRLGIKSEPATVEFAQIVALRKTVRLRRWESPEWDSITLGAGTDAERLAKARKYIEDRHNVRLPEDVTELLPKADRWGNGWGTTKRLDMSLDEIDKASGGLRLYHRSGNMLQFLKNLVDGGGVFSSTSERLRLGSAVDIGMSPRADMETGGAQYIFTRLGSIQSASLRSHVAFKKAITTRADAVTYDRDKFGDTTSPEFRKSTFPNPSDWKAVSRTESNETFYKRGVGIFDDDGIDFVTFATRAEAEDFIAFMQSHGYDKWPDGRKLSEAIRHR